MKLCLILVLLLSLPAVAATHWVSPNGTAPWTSCIGTDSTQSYANGTGACSLATALANATAGDTVYLRSGSYARGSNNGIEPANGGTNMSAMLNFWAYNGETVTVTGNGSYAIYLAQKNYVSIKGISFSGNGWGQWANITNNSNHNEVASCTFVSTDGGRLFHIGPDTPSDASDYGWATNNWIHDNTFSITGQGHGTQGRGCTDGGYDTMRIGGEYGTGGWPGGIDQNYNNTIEGNFFEHAEHAALDSYGARSVIRNNIFHNEPWSPGCSYTSVVPPTYSSSNPNYSAYNGMYAHRNLHITEDYNRVATYMLVEGNRSGYASPNQMTGGVENFAIGAPQNIVRYNFSYGSLSSGITLKWEWNSGLNKGGHGGTYNRIYNNTVYQSGYGYPLGLTAINPNAPYVDTAIAIDDTDGTAPVGNVVKNNLFYLSGGYTSYGADILRERITDVDFAYSGWSALADGSHNWCSGTQTASGGAPAGDCAATGNPSFVNPDISNPASRTLPNLALSGSSPAIDGGTWLTTSTNAASTPSTILTVADALYFQDGTWGSDLAKAASGLGGTFQADWICIGVISNCEQISSVAYGTYSNPAGTITLAAPSTWSNGAHIWLYRKSDGTVVLSGAAPDYGASEYGSGDNGPLPPTGLTAIVR